MINNVDIDRKTGAAQRKQFAPIAKTIQMTDKNSLF